MASGSTAQVVALQALSVAASSASGLNPATPIYAVVSSDTFLPLATPDSWGEFSAKYETQLSDYPQEYGAYQPYNKVKRPIEVMVQLIKTGSDLARFAWLAAIQQQESNSPEQLYTLISPQLIATDYSLSGLSYETRQDRGSNKLFLNLRFTEIPQIASSSGTYTDTLSANSSPVSQLGQLYTNAMSAATTALVNAKSFIMG
ncbi:MAG: hypothetical protein P4L92_18755 [Rudaea sp.]|nr:hypothetical protein [Rudaea sp.]